MNKIFKYSLALMTAAFTFAACSDSDDNYEKAAWDAAEGYFDVAFPVAAINEELDPVDPQESTLSVVRRNKVGEATVSFEVLVNTDDVFSVGEAHFNDGDSATTFKVTYPKAEIGKPYKLKLRISDPKFASVTYGSENILDFTVTRVKWNDVGYYFDENGNKVEGWALYTDDFITAAFGVSNVTFPTRIQERDDMKGYFRLINTYHENYPYNDPGDWDDKNDYYIYIDATDPDEVYIPQNCPIGVNWTYGWMSVWSMSGYYLNKYASEKDSEYLETAAEYFGTYANGKITFPKDALLYNYGTGGLRQANGNAAFKLVIDPALDLYTADVKTDFEWTKEFTGVFFSEQLGTTGNVTIYKGTCTATKDDADKIFEETYGTLYRLESPYAEGYDIFFTQDAEGNIKVPAGYELQATGLDAVGTPVYAKISGANSEYRTNYLELAMTFQNEDGSLTYGKATEKLINPTYTEVGTGVYTYNEAALSDGGGSFYEGTENATLYHCNELPEQYYLKPWAKSEDGLNFTISAVDGKIRFYQFTGEAFQDYGDVYFIDLEAYNPDYTKYLGEYDAETKTFEFCGAYYIPGAGSFGLISETFKLNSVAGPLKPAARSNSLKLMFKNYKAANRFGKAQPTKQLLFVAGEALMK